MKDIIITTCMLSLSAIASHAAVTTFQNPDVDDADAPTTYTVDGITMTITSSTGTLLTENAGGGFWGVDGGTNVNATQNKRVYSAEAISFSFDTAVTLSGIGFNNQAPYVDPDDGQIASLTSSGTAFDALSYTSTDIADTVYGIHTWGYSSGSFAIQSTENKNTPDYLLFGTGGNSVVSLAANEVVTFTASNVGEAGGGIGLYGVQVDVIPEPSSSVLLGLAGMALVLRRRR